MGKTPFDITKNNKGVDRDLEKAKDLAVRIRQEYNNMKITGDIEPFNSVVSEAQSIVFEDNKYVENISPSYKWFSVFYAIYTYSDKAKYDICTYVDTILDHHDKLDYKIFEWPDLSNVLTIEFMEDYFNDFNNLKEEDKPKALRINAEVFDVKEEEEASANAIEFKGEEMEKETNEVIIPVVENVQQPVDDNKEEMIAASESAKEIEETEPVSQNSECDISDEERYVDITDELNHIYCTKEEIAELKEEILEGYREDERRKLEREYVEKLGRLYSQNEELRKKLAEKEKAEEKKTVIIRDYVRNDDDGDDERGNELVVAALAAAAGLGAGYAMFHKKESSVMKGSTTIGSVINRGLGRFALNNK